MTIQISTIELNPELANLAYEMGLNVSKTCENALKEAIRRLQGLNSDFTSVRNAEAAGSNPSGSAFIVYFPSCNPSMELGLSAFNKQGANVTYFTFLTN